MPEDYLGASNAHLTANVSELSGLIDDTVDYVISVVFDASEEPGCFIGQSARSAPNSRCSAGGYAGRHALFRCTQYHCRNPARTNGQTAHVLGSRRAIVQYSFCHMRKT